MPNPNSGSTAGALRTWIVLTVLALEFARPDSAAAPKLAWIPADGYSFLPLERAGPEGAGFTEVEPASAGIPFTNRLSELQMTQNYNLMNGSGVAAGDFDGDGWCDLYFCAIAGTNALYRNLGGWTFEEVPGAGGAPCPGWGSTGAVFADVDGDRNLDLLVSTMGAGVKLFWNEGGRFVNGTGGSGLVQEGGATSMALADIEMDGDLDLYVAHYGSLAILRASGSAGVKWVNGKPVVTGPYARRLRFANGRLEERGEPDILYLNDGSGRFTRVPWDSGVFLDEDGQPLPEPWDFGLSAVFRDIDLDGDPDLYVCNDFQTVDRLWLNLGGGTFRLAPRVALRKQSFSSMGVDFGDIDRDGALDFFVTEMLGRLHSRRMRDISGMAVQFPMPGGLETRPEVVRNTLFRNRGDMTFAEIALYAGVEATDWSWQPFFLDVDLDGWEDLLVCNGMPFNVQDRDVIEEIRSLGRQTPEAARLNLLRYPSHHSPNVAFRNQGGWKFEDASAAWGFDSTKISQGAALADLDNDGDLDIVSNALNDGPLLCRNDASGPRIAVRLRGPPGNAFGAGAVIRVSVPGLPVQQEEIMAGGRYLSGDDSIRAFAVKAGIPAKIEIRWPGGRISRLKELPANRVYRVEYPAESAPPLDAAEAENPCPWFHDETAELDHSHHERAFSDFLYQPLLMKLFSQLGPGAAWRDLDGDGWSELIIGSGAGGAPGIFTFGAEGWKPVSPALPPVPDDLTGMAAWADSNGRRGLLLAKSNYESRAPSSAIYLLSSAEAGGVQIQKLRLDLGGVVIGPLAAADIDGDGDLDLFAGGRLMPGAYPRPADSFLFVQENGQLKPHSQSSLFQSLGLVSAAVWSDLNSDGFAELVLACEWGPPRIFWNERGRFTERTAELGLAEYTGWWNGINTGDFDGDGRLDIIACNWGENTGWRVSPERPLACYYGDMAGRGAMDLFMAEFAEELGAAAPVRNLNALGQAFPVLRRHFPTHESFARASAEAVLRHLPAPEGKAEARTFSTMLFLNRGARFEPRRLPDEAQLAPAFAAVVADFNIDGREDLFLSQNFFALRPELPRLDAGRGLLLEGRGDGSLKPVPGQASGIKVYGEQRAAIAADYDLDGRPDLIVTQNGAPVRVFRNGAARAGLRVRLRGPAGNPDGIGAQLRLEYPDGLGPVRELHAGSGYLAQDDLAQILGSAAKPEALRILWPGGTRQRIPLNESSGEIQVSFPLNK